MVYLYYIKSKTKIQEIYYITEIFMSEPKKNNIYEIKIDSVSSDGSGVGRIDGFTVFVPQTVTGDVVRALILKVQKNYAYAKSLEILVSSPFRQNTPCPYFSQCGGCSLLHINYDYQLEIKKGIIENALRRIGKTTHPVDEMLGADNPYRYRNKMVFPIGKSVAGKTICGFYRQKSHDIVALEDCLLGDDFNNRVIKTVLWYMEKYNVPPYDEKNHSGVIRRIFTRKGAVSGEVMVVISAAAETLPRADRLVSALNEILETAPNIILNINKEKNNLVLGRKNIVLSGKGTMTDKLCGAEYEISPHSFYQVNHAQTEKLYKKALEYAAPRHTDTVLDIYCGIGTISLYAANFAAKVVGVEIVPSAIKDAKENAQKNKIMNAEFYCADAAQIVPKLIDAGTSPDIVILDPPRKGSDEKTLSATAHAAPEKIVYISCNPATLARDVCFLEARGYAVKKVCGVDMFPNTPHVETITLLQKRNT